MFRVIVLLESKPLSQSQITGIQVVLKNIHVFRTIHLSFNLDQFSSSCCRKTFPQHDAATTLFHCGDGVLGVMRCVGFAPDIAFSLMLKNSVLVSSHQSTFLHIFGSHSVAK
ncbi:hypothetical protein AMECASPLE_028911 [Ameca splendens]|uniref:Uncharacterized protein n=1 Tax=Ameca splendens TaxID=208324 RepID=A0ABV0ZGY0_9TELE